MDFQALNEHDLVARPEVEYGGYSLAHDHGQAEEDPPAGRLHPPAQDEGSGAQDPREKPQGREKVIRAADAHEVHRELERCGRVTEDVRVDHEGLQYYGAQQDHHHPQVGGNHGESQPLYRFHGMLLFTRYSLRVQLADAARQVRGARSITQAIAPTIAPRTVPVTRLLNKAEVRKTIASSLGESIPSRLLPRLGGLPSYAATQSS